MGVSYKVDASVIEHLEIAMPHPTPIQRLK